MFLNSVFKNIMLTLTAAGIYVGATALGIYGTLMAVLAPFFLTPLGIVAFILIFGPLTAAIFYFYMNFNSIKNYFTGGLTGGSKKKSKKELELENIEEQKAYHDDPEATTADEWSSKMAELGEQQEMLLGNVE